VLSPGERAVTIPVDDLASHAGRLRSGDRIDLYFGQRQAGDAVLAPLLQQVEILAVGDSFAAGVDGESRPYSTVTLRVPASDAPRVLLAQQAGELQLLLRGVADQQAGSGAIRSSRELLRRAAPRSTGGGVEVLTGGNGKLTPDRTWLGVGAGVNAGAT
jgi:pilus assembly protein CpaB